MHNIDQTQLLMWGGGIIFAAVFITIFNRIVSYAQSVKSAASSIEVELRKRLSLVPQVVETAKKYLSHERGVLKEFTRLRARVEKTPENDIAAQVQNQKSFFDRLFAVAEAYPQLRSSDVFVSLEHILQDTEENLAAARHIYNSNVDIYNSYIHSFPAMILAGLFGYKEEPFLSYNDPKLHDDPDIKALFEGDTTHD